MDVFVSVGSTATAEQESFVRAVEDRLRSEGLIPNTVGRNTFSADTPLKAVTELMDRCSGAVVIAFERIYFSSGVEKRGGRSEVTLANVKLSTPWNQIEAAMAYSRGLPLLVIVEDGLRSEGLLEHGYDWYVQSVRLEVSALSTLEFNGVLASWKEKVSAARGGKTSSKAVGDSTIAELVGGLQPAQLWSALTALMGLIAGAFALGMKLHGGH